MDLDVHKDFESMSEEISKNYRRNLSKDSPRNVFRFLAQYVDQVLGLLSAQPADPLRAPAHPELSSIGVVDKHLQSKFKGSFSTIEVEEWLNPVEVINRFLLTNIWTWNGQM